MLNSVCISGIQSLGQMEEDSISLFFIIYLRHFHVHMYSGLVQIKMYFFLKK